MFRRLKASLHEYPSKKGLTFRSVWLVFAAILMILGFVLGRQIGLIDNESPIMFWLIWGLICSLADFAENIKFIFRHGTYGAENGSNQYNVEVEVSDYYVSASASNHSNIVIGFIIGIVTSLFVCALFGPIFIGLKIIFAIIYIIKCIVYFNKQKPKKEKAASKQKNEKVVETKKTTIPQNKKETPQTNNQTVVQKTEIVDKKAINISLEDNEKINNKADENIKAVKGLYLIWLATGLSLAILLFSIMLLIFVRF